MSQKLTRTPVRHQEHVPESPEVIWRPSEMFTTCLFLRKTHFLTPKWPETSPRVNWPGLNQATGLKPVERSSKTIRVRTLDDGFGEDLMCENFVQRGLGNWFGRTPSLPDWRPQEPGRRVLRTMISTTGDNIDCNNTIHKLGALPFAKGEGVRSTLLHHWDSEILIFLDCLRHWDSEILRLSEMMTLWNS